MAEAAEFHGTRPSPARRWLRQAAAVVLAVPLLSLAAQVPAAHAAGAPAAAEPTGSRTVDVSLNTLTPQAPAPDDTVTVTGTVTNKSKQAISDAHVALRTGPLLDGRTAIDNAAQRTGYLPGADGTEIDGKYTEKYERLAAGARREFSISVPAEDLQLSSDGVYQLSVTLDGRTAAVPWQDQVLGIQRTFLPWQTEPTERQSRTTYLWPLISSSHVTARTAPDLKQTRVFDDDELAKEISPGGRLERMVALGKELDITWVIDPDLLASVDAMHDGYRLPSQGDETVPGAKKNRDAATTWLNELSKAVAGKKIVSLPFADPDIASIAHHGKSVPGTLGSYKDATEVAADAVDSILHVRPSTDFAWPVDGAIDRSVVDVATSAGANKVIARSDSLQERGYLPYTPSATRPIGRGVTAVVADARLSTAFQGDMTSAENATLATQKFLAQSLTLTRQDEERQRTVVVAPQRMPTASQAQTMANALHALEDGRWSLPQDLDQAAKAKADPDASTRIPSASAYPKSLRKQELPRTAFESLRGTEQRLTDFEAILSEPSRVATPFGRAIERGLSTTWRGRPAEAATYRTDVRNYLTNLTSQVQLIDKTDAKLSGRSATIPVTVQNNLVQDVQNLTLRLTSTKPTRLKIGDSPFQERPIKISGGHSQTVKFTTTINANGPVPVKAQLYTADGRPYGEPVEFAVDATEITSTVMLVIAGGVLLLVLAGLRMYTQRKRASRGDGPHNGDAPAPSEGDGPEGDAGSDPPAGGDGADAGRQKDGAAGTDTGTESSEPSGAGERVDR
ncbi:DUF6049 family protein [Streptomyces sp. NPDC007088]|uniref:DUF6049 family protein n=1 Tax=Streptomyces sp. NPDC007088 TaxID=3364773 RepID=UPI0036B34BF8